MSIALGPHLGFSENQIDELRHPVITLPCNAVKIAVVALVKTEGHVNVQALDVRLRKGGRVQGWRIGYSERDHLSGLIIGIGGTLFLPEAALDANLPRAVESGLL